MEKTHVELGSMSQQGRKSRQDTTWPFVTLNSFQQRAGSARKLSAALFVSFVPLVQYEDRLAWENYTVNNSWWIDEGRAYQEETGLQQFLSRRRNLQESPTEAPDPDFVFNPFGVSNKIYIYTDTFQPIPEPGFGPYTPVWQTSPVLQVTGTNVNLVAFPTYKEGTQTLFDTGDVVLGGFDVAPVGDTTSDNPTTAFFAEILSIAAREKVAYNGDPMSTIYFPIYDTSQGERTLVAMLTVVLHWKSYFESILPPNTRGVVVVLKNACGAAYTYQIDGAVVTPLGFGDLHDSHYDHMERAASFADLLRIEDGSEAGLKLNQDRCPYTIYVYP
jgi:hypothetical protein